MRRGTHGEAPARVNRAHAPSSIEDERDAREVAAVTAEPPPLERRPVHINSDGEREAVAPNVTVVPVHVERSGAMVMVELTTTTPRAA